MPRRWFAFAGVVLVILAATAFAMDIPRFVWGILTYGRQRREGTLQVGDKAPDAMVHDLSTGAERSISEWIGDKPLVIIFGSCT